MLPISRIWLEKKLGISSAVVNKQLKAASYNAYRFAWENLESYLISSEENSIQSSSGVISYTTYYSIGQRKNKLRDYVSAVEHFEKSIQLAKNKFGDRDLRLVPVYNGLAEAYLEQSIDDKAKEAIDASMLCQSNAPKMRSEYALTLNLLGNYYLEIKCYDQALENYNQGKQIIRDIYGADHPLLAAFDNNIAIAYKKLKNYEEALSYYKRSLEVAEKNKEHDAIGYADSLYNLGLCYEEMGYYDAALTQMERSLAILVSVLPAKHRYISETKEEIKRIRQLENN